MELIEAEFNEGVLRPMRRLRLRPGERVGIVVVRRPDPLRWDLARLSKVIRDEDALTEAGLAEWETTLSRGVEARLDLVGRSGSLSHT
jgi:predicted DNA-binding antitoxin AbrB/MazE fold protein